MKLSDFANKYFDKNTQDDKTEKQKSNPQTTENYKETNDYDETENITDYYNKYKDYSESDLTNELYKQVQKQKQEGTFDVESLKDSVDKMSSYLTDEQRMRINNMLNMLK